MTASCGLTCRQAEMDTNDIIQTLDSLTLGDKLIINDWRAKYTVCGISQRFVLAHYGQHYTIISRIPWDRGMWNGVRDGDIYCAPDWWIFGYVEGYDFTSEAWVKKYLEALETGETEMSQKRHAPVFFLSVVGHTNKVYRKASANPIRE